VFVYASEARALRDDGSSSSGDATQNLRELR
jgi:hypothetical protein